MNRKNMILLVAFGFLGLSLGTWAILMQSTQSVAASPPAQQEKSSEYLIILNLPRPEELNVPAGLSRLQAEAYAHKLVGQRAHPFLAGLKQLREEGGITDFEVLPEQNAISVQASDQAALERLVSRHETAKLVSSSDNSACAQENGNALREQVLGFSQMQTAKLAQPQAGTATDPSINVYAPTGSDWTYMWGYTTANTQVFLRILRGGREIAVQTTYSYNDGYYYFYPDWYCQITWLVQPGDVVEVTAHGSTVSTVVAYLKAWMDPLPDTVEGMTDPNRSVEVRTYAGGDNCSFNSYTITTPADSGGHFLADFTSQVNFNRLAYSAAYARDANGNSTYAYYDAYRLNTYFNDSSFWGVLRPSQAYTATLSRGGITIDTYAGHTDYDGWFYGGFSETIQSGDILAVTNGSDQVSQTTTFLNAGIDITNNRVGGTTGAGRKVSADFNKRDYGNIITTCSYDYSCASTTANGAGSFMLNSAFDLVRGDFADIYVYDSEGNYQAAERPSLAILTATQWDEVSGYWLAPGEDITITLKDSSNMVKDYVVTYTDSWDGEFDTNFWYPADIVAGDHIEITDGVFTEFTTVQNLTGRLNNNTEHLSGEAQNGPLLVEHYDFQREDGYWYYSCHETNATGGAYDLNLSSTPVGAQDDADVYSIGPDGHFTFLYAHAFEIHAYLDEGGGDVTGYTLSPNLPVNLSLWSGGTLLESGSTTSGDSGYYYWDPAVPVTFTQRIEVSSDLNATLNLPPVTYHEDPAQNRIWGQYLPGEPVAVRLTHDFLCDKGVNCSSSWSNWTAADAFGTFNASFEGAYWENWYSNQCFPMQVGSQCTFPSFRYYELDEDAVYYYPPYPSVEADAFEADNAPSAARPYTGLSHHTLHNYSDEDWISFTVGPGDVGRLYYLQTVNLGATSDTVIELYASDGSTLLADNDDLGGYNSGLLWVPSSSGTYYVRIKPYDAWTNADNCGATYDFYIAYNWLFLPLILR